MTLRRGDLLRVLPTLQPNTFDACVTDPPYNLGFMGKAWDGTGIAFNPETWRAVYRVLKPGAYLVAFGGTRTSHRMVCAIEDAGFQIRDSLTWLYGSGFPKSLNLGQGRGTALKPASEPIVLAWKPFKGTIAANVAQYGTGGLNIDACRIGTSAGDDARRVRHSGAGTGDIEQWRTGQRASDNGGSHLGRWPANVLLDEEAAAELNEQSGERTSGARKARGDPFQSGMFEGGRRHGGLCEASTGGASRFFYCAKPSRKEREAGCEGLPLALAGSGDHRPGGTMHERAGDGGPVVRRNTHPTVKPVALMRWLVRLVTPVGGTVLDCFAGSGTTGMACKAEARPCVLIEREAAYLPIIRARVRAAAMNGTGQL